MPRLAAGCVALIVAALAAGCGGGAARTVTRTVTAAAPTDERIFGRIVSARSAGGRFELRFDPQWFLSGVTANVAQAEDDGVECRPSACPPVANDYYIVDESRRVLTFVAPAGVRGTVLERGPRGLRSKTVNMAELARLVAGTSTVRLFEPLASGVWLRVHIDTVRSFEQQYRP